MFVYFYGCTCECTSVHLDLTAWAFVYTYVCSYVYIYICVSASLHDVSVWICSTCVCVCIHACTHLYVCEHKIHIGFYTHLYVLKKIHPATLKSPAWNLISLDHTASNHTHGFLEDFQSWHSTTPSNTRLPQSLAISIYKQMICPIPWLLSFLNSNNYILDPTSVVHSHNQTFMC